MNVAFFCEGFDRSSIFAQPWKHVYEIARRMHRLGDKVCIISDHFSASSRYECIRDIPVYRISKKGLLLNLKDLLNVQSEIDVDVLNWYGGPLSALYFLRLQKCAVENVVWTLYKGKIFHEDLANLRVSDFSSITDFWTNILYSLCPSSLVRTGGAVSNVKKITTWSKRLKSYLLSVGLSSEIEVVPPGVDTKKFQPKSAAEIVDHRKQLGFDTDDFVILYFGPMSRFRGVDTILSAMQKICENIPSAKLLLLDRQVEDSTGKTRTIERITKANQAIRIVRGIQTSEQLIHYLSMARVVVLPFRFWPHIEYPLTILEAMSMEKPVITTLTGTIPEIVRNDDTGILVPPGEPNGVVTAITRLSRNEDLCVQMGKRAREYVENFHDWDIIVERTRDIFRMVSK